MRSDKQIEASRRNGALSRSPLTPEGKAATCRDATTHGLRGTLRELEHHASRYFRASDRAIRRLRDLRQLPPPCPLPPPEKAARIVFLANEPKKVWTYASK